MSFKLQIVCVLVGCLAACITPPDQGRHDLGIPIDFIDMARNTTSCVGGGSVCSSVNPGKCDVGTVTCDGERAMCTPNSAVQDCYDGPVGTAGVGVCQAGTQSCIGILGECTGQILPAPKENCLNDLDDDCDGKVNNGCPESIGTGTVRYPTPIAGNSTNAGQVALESRCPQDAFVVRADITFYDPQFSITRIDLYCAKATLTRPPFGTTYTLGTTPVMPQPFITFQHADSYASVDTGNPVNGACNTVGGGGLRAVWKTRAKYDAGGFLGMYTQCGLAVADLQPDNTMAINVTATGSEKGYLYNLNGTDVSWTCAAGEVVVGYKGKADITSIDQLQPVCAPLTVRYTQ